MQATWLSCKSWYKFNPPPPPTPWRKPGKAAELRREEAITGTHRRIQAEFIAGEINCHRWALSHYLLNNVNANFLSPVICLKEEYRTTFLCSNLLEKLWAFYEIRPELRFTSKGGFVTWLLRYSIFQPSSLSDPEEGGRTQCILHNLQQSVGRN